MSIKQKNMIQLNYSFVLINTFVTCFSVELVSDKLNCVKSVLSQKVLNKEIAIPRNFSLSQDSKGKKIIYLFFNIKNNC